MSRRDFIGGGGGFEIVDADGSFARFVRNGAKEMKQAIQAVAIKPTCFALQMRMEANAPTGPEAPHIKQRVTHKVRGLVGQVGYINATEPAAPGSTSTIADVALYNEYRPNKQPFMRPAADDETGDFLKRMRQAIARAERNLSGGGGLL